MENKEKKIRILFVDDTPENLQLLYEVLQDGERYMFNVARNGSEAVDVVKKINFDLILLDVQMPVMDGFEACEHIKKVPAYETVPIIFLTAQNDKDSIVKALELGAVDYLTKPFCSLELKTKVRNHLSLKHYQDDLESIIEARTAKLEAALDELQKTTKVKDDFLSVMSHELRTPMNGIQGFTSLLLLGDNLDDQQKTYVEGIEDTSQRLQMTIESMFDYIFLQNNDFGLQVNEVKLQNELMPLLQVYKKRTIAKDISFHVSFSESFPEKVLIDFQKFQSVLKCLVDNALKFTHQGNVAISFDYSYEEERIYLKVSDTGIGIGKEDQKKIFDKFSQVDSSSSREYEGVGLGLAIVNELLRVMQGEITLQSSPDQGSSFSVTLPADHEESKFLELDEEEASADRPLNVLVVEDNKVNQALTRKVLQKMNHKVSIAENGLEALDIIGTYSFDLVIMDCMMPKMDGYEATKEIRKIDSVRDLPIIALTANTLEGDREKCLAAGMDDYLPKPLIAKDLAALIRRYS